MRPSFDKSIANQTFGRKYAGNKQLIGAECQRIQYAGFWRSS